MDLQVYSGCIPYYAAWQKVDAKGIALFGHYLILVPPVIIRVNEDPTYLYVKCTLVQGTCLVAMLIKS